MKLVGKAHRLKQNDDINTDYIISGRYKFKIQDPAELARHVMEDLEPDFYKRIQPGDFIVAGKNFGCGSSREQAPQAIKYAGISAVIAKSFARIFYRNAYNLGLPAVEAETDNIEEGDELDINFDAGIISNKSKKQEIRFAPLSRTMQVLLEEGGLVEHFKKHGGFKI